MQNFNLRAHLRLGQNLNPILISNRTFFFGHLFSFYRIKSCLYFLEMISCLKKNQQYCVTLIYISASESVTKVLIQTMSTKQLNPLENSYVHVYIVQGLHEVDCNHVV